MSMREPIAIVGVSAIFPGSTDMAGFWNDILQGKDLLTDVPPHYWLIDDYYDPDPSAPDKTYGRRGAFLQPVEFDALEFGIPPSALPAIDSAQLLGLIGAKRVLADAARGRENHVPKDRIGIYLGLAATTSAAMSMAGRLQRPAWVKGMREAGIPESLVQKAVERIAACFHPLQENTFPGILSNVVSGRIANRFDLRGPNFITDAACASSLAAISVGINDLHLGNTDMVITGGVDALNDIQMFMCFSKTPALSPTGDCRPFASNADGTMLGEGLALFALRRLSDAESSGDHIYAVIRGLGSSSDGLAKSVYAPRPEGQAEALRRAYRSAGYDPGSVELVEAHGTATIAGDQAELKALREVFGEAQPEARQWCALGSVKSQIGHSKGAAGAAGLFKVAMALHHKVLPPTIKVDQPNPALQVEESPFYINTETRPWIHAGPSPRRASLSSFGFGGTNFHMTLEEYRGPAPRPTSLTAPPAEIALISAEAASEGARQCRQLSNANSWRSAARNTLQAFDATAPVRMGVVAANQEEFAGKLQQLAALVEASPEQAVHEPGLHFEPARGGGPVALLFSGQGSQYVNMGRDLALSFHLAREAWDFGENFFTGSGFSPRACVFPIPVFDADSRHRQEERLRQTEHAQPALALASLAQLSLLRAAGLHADFAAGHSFGEAVALHAAGCFSASDLLRIAKRRGELMAEAAAGTMTAVSHSLEEVRQLLSHHAEPNGVVIASHNAPKQYVLSGEVTSIEAVEQRLAQASIAFRRLPVSGAFHSPLMSSCVEPFQALLATIDVQGPKIPVFSNSSAAAYPQEPERIRETLAAGLIQPVLFTDELNAMYRAGARIFVEVGAGSVLRQLTGQCLHDRPHTALSIGQRGQNDVLALWHALAHLSVAGVRLQLDSLFESFQPATPVTPSKNPASTIRIDGAGYNRPYPPKGGAAALPKPNPEPAPLPAVPTPQPPLPSPATPPAAIPVDRPQRTSPARLTAASDSLFEQVQAQIAESQKATQAAILESLSITLKSLETVARDLSGLPSVPVETAATPPPRLDLVPKPPAEPVTLPPQAANVKPESRPLVEPPRPEPSIASKAQAPDWQRKLIQIISEKTGYPAEALSLDVELEAGLGIDSIKRVEIFSTLQQQYPGRIEVTPADMGQLKTIRDILRHLNHDQAKPQALPPTVPDPSSPNVQATVLAVVAEKTGYPAEALGLDVDLESGLGIDSIKRVEIFSALQQRLPSIPAFQPEHAGRLRTLGDIIEFIGKPAASPQPDIIRKEAQPNKVRDLEAIPNKRSSTEDLLLTIVAEKTGYPADALQLEANLEADLGIDSIKRVEIFSALQQRLPSLPAFGAEQAGRLRTLAEIVRFLDGEDPSAAPESIPLDRFEVRYEMCAPSGLPLPNLFTAPLVAVLGNPENAIAEAVVQLLKQAGVAAELHRQVPDTCGAAIDLRGLEPANDIDAALQTNNDAFSTAQVLTRCPGGPQLFVTAGTSDEPFSSWRAGAAGVLRTFLREYPAASGKAIAIQTSGRSAGDIAADIASELLFGGSQVDILLAAGARLKPVLKQSDAQPNPSRIGPQSVVIATGGGRGVTAACLLELARTARPRIAILGRTELADEPLEYRHAPDEAALKLLLTRQAGPGANLAAISEKVKQLLAVREIRSTLQALEEAGSAALYVACDVRSQASVARALETVRAKFGPITALIHGSGVIADKRIEDKQPDQFEAVFSTKVHGARTLLEATAHDPVDTICLFSSVAAFFGNPGQCDYAAANEVLNHLADAEAERRGDRSLVRSIGWGPWDGGMVSAPLAAHFKSKGTSLIPLAQGAQAFVREISKPGGPARVLLTALSRGAAFQEQSRDEWTTNIAVGRHTHPFLDGHRIQTQAVIPAVLVAEWFHRAALELMPEAPPLVCQDLRVLRGIPLPEFDRSGHRFELTAAKEGQSIRCELRSREFGLHYTAVLMPSPSAHPGQSIIPALEGNAAAIYGPGSDLFHGREFQVIEQLSLSDDGALACLRTTTRMDWPSEPWLTDPAALDGVLQVIRLWGVKHLGGRSLPTRIGSLEWKQPRSQRDQVFCTVRCRKAGSLSIVADAELIDPQGNLLAVAREIEMHLSPSA